MDESHSLTFDESQGALKFGTLRHLLVRPETLAEIQKGVEDRLGPKSAEYLYSAGASWAVAACRRLRLNIPEGAQSLALAMCRHATELGWGRWVLQSFQPEARKLAVEVVGSPFSEAYGSSDQPVCHLLAGAISGMAENILGMSAACVEQACRAQGGPRCLFVATGLDVAGKESWDW